MSLSLPPVLIVTDRALPQDLAASFSKALTAIGNVQSLRPLDMLHVPEKDKHDKTLAEGIKSIQVSGQGAVPSADPAVANSSDMPKPFERTAVFVTSDRNGDTNGATVVTISNDRMGGQTKISIQKAEQRQGDVLSSVTFSCECGHTQQDPAIVYGHISHGLDNGHPSSLFLISPAEGGSPDQDLYLFASVTSVDTVDPANVFSNSGFNTFSGRDSYQTFGGAVSIGADDKKFIVWLDTSQYVPSQFNGEMAARAGILDASSELPSSIVAGRGIDLRLIFLSGVISEIWQGSNRIENFDLYVRSRIEESTGVFPVGQDTIYQQNNFITNNAFSFSDGIYERNYTFATAMNHNSLDDVRRRNDLANKRMQDILKSRV